jgi:hypothetical protein
MREHQIAVLQIIPLPFLRLHQHLLVHQEIQACNEQIEHQEYIPIGLSLINLIIYLLETVIIQLCQGIGYIVDLIVVDHKISGLQGSYSALYLYCVLQTTQNYLSVVLNLI